MAKCRSALTTMEGRSLRRQGKESDRASLAQNDVHGGFGGVYRSSDAPSSPDRAQIKSSMVQFFEDVDMLKKKINAIKEATIKISELTQESILATSHEKTALSSQINPLVQASIKMLTSLRRC